MNMIVGLYKGGREQEWRETFVNFGIKNGFG